MVITLYSRYEMVICVWEFIFKVDLLDLLPENIELANDEELDEDTAMSPQVSCTECFAHR